MRGILCFCSIIILHVLPAQQLPTPEKISPTISPDSIVSIDDGNLQGNSFYYVYKANKMYEIYIAPGKVTAIILQADEHLINAPALGEVSFFSIGAVDAYYDGELRQQIHIKALTSSSSTNIILNTNKRSYFLLLRSRPFTYMVAVLWHYPESELEILGKKKDDITENPPISNVTDQLNFMYELIVVRGRQPDWFPLRVFDDGRKTYVQFPNAAQIIEVPVLFVLRGGSLNVVSYRIEREYYVYDGLFQEAELRSEGKRRRDSYIVRIVKK